MTEPLSDERIVEIANRSCLDYQELCEFCALATDDLLVEVLRLKAAQAIPPDVLAAMERYRKKPVGRQGDIDDAFTITTWAVSHHGKDGA